MKPLLHTIPIVLIGTSNTSQINYMEVGDVAVASLNPPLLMISLHQRHLSTANIRQNGVLSVNLADVDMMASADRCGMISGHEQDKSKIFDSTLYNIDEMTIPFIKTAPISHICKVEKEVYIENHYVFILRVHDTMIREDLLIDGTLHFDKINPLHYGLDNHYYNIGSVIGTGYNEGKIIK